MAARALFRELGAHPVAPCARRLSGETLYVDGGVNIMA
jgi:enoyl-[acyl-carrier-protein] reductase (NADH)